MSSCSESDPEGFTCFWTIENFEVCRFTDDLELVSETFEVMWNNYRFHLKISHTEDDFLNVCLYKENFGSDIQLNFSVSLLRHHGNTIKSSFSNQIFISGGEGYGASQLIKWDDLFQKAQPYDSDINITLTVSFHMWKERTKKSSQCFLISGMKNDEDILHLSKNYFSALKQNTWIELMSFLSQKTLYAIAKKNDNVPTEEASIQTDTKVLENTFEDEDELLRFFAEEKFCYVTLRTASKDFAVHKALICAKSPVFNAMFHNHLKESERNIVDIDDIDDETLSLLLQFLHLQPLKELNWETTIKLYYAADKYQIEQLKNECRMHLKNQLTTENICELFSLAHMHGDKDLKYCAQEYFDDHYLSILQSKEWNDLLFNRTDLASDILRIYAQNASSRRARRGNRTRGRIGRTYFIRRNMSNPSDRS